MRIGLSRLLGACIFAAAPAFAQSPLSLPDMKNSTIPAPTVMPAPVQEGKGSVPAAQIPAIDPPANAEPLFNTGPTVDPFKFWARGEYLMYWVKNAPMPISLVTGDPTNPTQELLNSDQNFGPFSGMRFAMGTWFDPGNTRGVEATFFWLQRRTQTFAANSDSTGTPTLQFPFVNTSPGAVGDSLMPIAYPGIFAGGVTVASTLQLWGAEANGVLLLTTQQSGVELTALAGVRYVDLQENLDISSVSSALLTTPNTILSQTDQFNTRNQFYGGQLGLRARLQEGNFAFDMTAKLALGVNHQSVDIQGASSQTGPGGVNGTFPGGLFTQPSNIGHYSSNQFAVVPAVELKLHYFITPRWSAFLGYDFMYWSSVVRPGNQIDRNINLTQSAVLGNGALNGPAFPTQSFNRSDFWAQGATFGFEFRY